MFPTQFTSASFTWERKEFSKIVQRISTANSNKSLPNIEFEDIDSEIGTLNKSTSQLYKRKKGILFEKNNILFGKLRPYLKKWFLADFSGIAVGDFWVLKPSDNQARFVYYLIQTSSFYNVSNITSGTKMPRSDWKLVSKTKFYIPMKLSEKHKLGMILYSIDKLINLHERKIIQLKQMQKCIQQIITTSSGKNWEFIKLKNILKERKLLSTKSKNYPLVSFTVNDGVTPKTKRYEREQLVRGNVDNKKYKVTKLNDIVYNPANLKFGAIGRNKFGNAVFSPIYITFEAHDIDIIFLETLLTDPNFIKKSLKYQQGTVYERQSVSPKDLLNMKIIYPPYDLQLKFGHLFGSIQKKIDLEQRKLDQLIKFKNFLLQNMFI